jgi:hypothetical protein
VTLHYRVDHAEILHDVNFNMPGVLEVIETPASPSGRAVAAGDHWDLLFSLGWVSLIHIDIVASIQRESARFSVELTRCLFE